MWEEKRRRRTRSKVFSRSRRGMRRKRIIRTRVNEYCVVS
jgi:hypothetical protein